MGNLGNSSNPAKSCSWRWFWTDLFIDNSIHVFRLSLSTHWYAANSEIWREKAWWGRSKAAIHRSISTVWQCLSRRQTPGHSWTLLPSLSFSLFILEDNILFSKRMRGFGPTTDPPTDRPTNFRPRSSPPCLIGAPLCPHNPSVRSTGSSKRTNARLQQHLKLPSELPGRREAFQLTSSTSKALVNFSVAFMPSTGNHLHIPQGCRYFLAKWTKTFFRKGHLLDDWPSVLKYMLYFQAQNIPQLQTHSNERKGIFLLKHEVSDCFPSEQSIEANSWPALLTMIPCTCFQYFSHSKSN